MRKLEGKVAVITGGPSVRGDAAKLLLESADGEALRSIRDLAKMAVLLGRGRS